MISRTTTATFVQWSGVGIIAMFRKFRLCQSGKEINDGMFEGSDRFGWLSCCTTCLHHVQTFTIEYADTDSGCTDVLKIITMKRREIERMNSPENKKGKQSVVTRTRVCDTSTICNNGWMGGGGEANHTTKSIKIKSKCFTKMNQSILCNMIHFVSRHHYNTIL